MSQQKPDRYVNFQGIDCDGRARRILGNIEQYTDNPPHNSPWSNYFQTKCGERLSIGQDELHFVCSQMNNVYSLFDEYEDTDALNLLEQIEEECC
ncbi:MAG: N(2)-fixation sustaining protein CowN [Cyanobacteria bacterium P01_A01_bin.83]